MTIALIGLALGEISLLLDLGNRLFGTYARTRRRALARIFIVVCACILLAMPACIFLLNPASLFWRIFLYAASFAGFLSFLHFIFPYRFGIRRATKNLSHGPEKILVSGIMLHDERVSVSSSLTGRDSIRFLFISDLHCNTEANFNLIKSAFAKLGDEIFDVILLLGDLSENRQMLLRLMNVIADLKNGYGIFCVRSNHDFEQGRQILIKESAQHHSIKILSNTWYDIPQLGIGLLGLEYPWLRTQITSKSECSVTLGLAHTPDNIILFHKLGVDIVVAGHTHGGKFHLPVIGPLLVPSKFGRFLDMGWFKLGHTLMYVTSGVGCLPGHGGQKGELLRLTIKSGEQKMEPLSLKM